MLLSTISVGLRFSPRTPVQHFAKKIPTVLSSTSRRTIAYSLHVRPSIRCSTRAPPTTTSGSSTSFFTPSLCRTPTRRYASTSTDPNTRIQVMDWNTFFNLRTSRRRYALASSILSAFLTTGSAFVFLSTQPEMADEITKLVPTDPFVSMGIVTFGATLLGWLLGPVFGNAIWRLFHRARLAEFTLKEKTFFERIKRHRVNPAGASTNNPVPDFYGEKIGSVAGYRRWLKDQRVFNRKKEGSYKSTTPEVSL